MKKYQKITNENQNTLNIHSKEQALTNKNYVFPSVDSLTQLNNAKNIQSENNLNAFSSGKSLQNLETGSILDMSQTNLKPPQSVSTLNLSQFQSIQQNPKPVKKEKSQFDLDQKHIFENHLRYISRSSQVLDKVKQNMPKLQLDNKQKENQNFLPIIQTNSASMSSLTTLQNKNPNQSQKQKEFNKYGLYSRSVEPTRKSIVNNNTNSMTPKQKVEGVFEQIMNQLSNNRNEKNIQNTNETSTISQPSKFEQCNLSFQQKEDLEQKTKQSLFIHLQNEGEEKNTYNKLSDLFAPQSKRLSERSQDTVNTTQFNNNNSQLRKSLILSKKQPLFHQYEDKYMDGYIGSNIEEKFNFFKNTPVGSIITILKKSVNIKGLQSPSNNSKQSSYPTTKSNKNNGSQHQSMSQYFQQYQQQGQTKKEEDLKNKQLPNTKRSSINPSNNQYLNILKKQAQIQKINKSNYEQKFCQMSKRMFNFFQDQENFIIWDRYVVLCRNFKRFIDVLFKIEKNLNKNMNYLTRLAGNKTYLINEIMDQQFNLIHFGVIESLENTLISENTLKAYFRVDQDLKTIITDTYIKDLSHINGIFEIYLNNQQIIQSTKISESIQAEYKMIKDKEKDLIYDQIDNNGIKNANFKKSYEFFNGYLYNIKPRRNTYQEIQDFEKNFGQFQYLSQIDRDMFLNLEKSYNTIRQSNKQ